MSKRKHVKKNKPVICSDANELRRKSIQERKRKDDALIKKIAEYNARRIAAMGGTGQEQPISTDGFAKEPEE